MRRFKQLLGGWLVATAIVPNIGCLTLPPRFSELPPECLAACRQAPCCNRSKVYVFLIDGFDPCDHGIAATTRSDLIQLGFIKIYDGHAWNATWFADEIRRLNAEVPDARFVLVGFSTAAEAARGIAVNVGGCGIAIDLLCAVDGKICSAKVGDKPGNVGEFMHLQGMSKASSLSADTIVLAPETMPASTVAFQQLAESLAAIANSIPVPVMPENPTPPAEQTPTPRPAPIKGFDSAKRDEWDFLKPLVRLDFGPEDVGQVIPKPVERSSAKKSSSEEKSANSSPNKP